VLADPEHEIRRILEHEKIGGSELPGLVLLDVLHSSDLTPHIGVFDTELDRAIFDPWPANCRSMILLPLKRQNKVIGSLNLLEACVAVGSERVIFASTGGAIYGEVPDGQIAGIDTPPAPVSPYACSKFAVENYLHAYRSEHGLQFTILRYANVYGPRQDPHGEAGVVAIFIQRLLAKQPIRINARKRQGDEGCVRDYVFVEDVVRANRLAAEGGVEMPILNVCSSVATTTLELAGTLESVLGCRAEISYAARREGDVERSVLAQNPDSPLGQPTPLRKGLTQTVRWFESR